MGSSIFQSIWQFVRQATKGKLPKPPTPSLIKYAACKTEYRN